MKDWKTTSTGITVIAGAIVTVLFNISNGTPITETLIMGAITSILAGCGLLFAKDSNTTVK